MIIKYSSICPYFWWDFKIDAFVWKKIFQICDAKTEPAQIEETLRTFLSRSDIGIVLITQDYAEQVRHVIDSHTAPIPTILEIPSKEKPYDPEKDSLLKRAK